MSTRASTTTRQASTTRSRQVSSSRSRATTKSTTPVKSQSPKPKSTTTKKSTTTTISTPKSSTTTSSSSKKSTTSPSPSRSKSTTRTPRKTQQIDDESPVKTPTKSRPSKTPTKQQPTTPIQRPISSSRRATLTTTPRYYPKLRKDIDVYDQYVDDDGDIVSPDELSQPHYIQPATESIDTMNKRQQYQYSSLAISNQDETTPTCQSLLFRALLLIVLFISAIGGIYLLLQAMPPIDPLDKAHIKLPRTVEEAKSLSIVIDKYKQQYPTYVFALFAATYMFLQAFAIPGAVFLSIIAGPIWGVTKGIFVISTVATAGSSICFLISKTIARPIFTYFFPHRIQQFKTQLEENRDNLFFYLLFLRIAPVFPNWLITISSPVLDVPYIHFAVATYIGIMPNNYIMTTIGTGLQNMTNSSKLMTPQAILSLCGVAVVAILPIVVKKIFTPKKQL